ncbi:MAG: pyridoxal phosphate-dependent aminotransferase [Rhizobiaceae bacterium]|nr:pyridoxal phosphate-dependent aminotransferase [Rhizobiaceae bacterium]
MTDDAPRLTALAHSLPATVPFVGPEAQERTRGGRRFRARLGANENGFGPSPRVVEAIANAAPEMWKYCDPESHELKEALSAHLGVPAANIAIGEGIDGLLGLTVRLYMEAGQPVVTSLGAYPTFNYHIVGFGGRAVAVPYRDDRESLDGLLEAVRQENPPLVYLSNPDNPMGSWWETAELERFMDALPASTMLLLDEAYGEFAPEAALPALDPSRKNVLRFRTFSKAYGLAGLRCGYAIGHADAITAFEKVRNHYGMSLMTQVAAQAALADPAHIDETRRKVARARDEIGRIARANGLKPLPSATNFVALDSGADGAFALKLMQALLDRDVFVRKPMAPGLDRCIRVSVGPDDELAIFAAELPGALTQARGN